MLFKYFKVQKDQFVPRYLLSLNIKQDYWSWSYWSSRCGGNCSVENWLNTKHYYINTIPKQKASILHIYKGNTYSEGISCMIHCSPAAMQEVPTGWCHMALLIGNISYKHNHATTKVFPWMAILHSNHESFPTRKFWRIQYNMLKNKLWDGIDILNSSCVRPMHLPYTCVLMHTLSYKCNSLLKHFKTLKQNIK